jgi:hypothetical protein
MIRWWHRLAELSSEIKLMSLSRTLVTVAAIALTFTSVTKAADTPVFAVAKNDHNGQAVVFESTVALKKGDVIKIRAFNAQFVAMLNIAMCNEDCPNMHIVKVVPLSFLGLPTSDQQIVLPEDGRVAISMQNGGASVRSLVGVGGGTPWTVQYVGPYATHVSENPTDGLVPASGYTLNDGTLRARFYHRTFVTVSLADTNI